MAKTLEIIAGLILIASGIISFIITLSIGNLNIDIYNDGGTVLTSSLLVSPIQITNIGMVIAGLFLMIDGIKSK